MKLSVTKEFLFAEIKYHLIINFIRTNIKYPKLDRIYTLKRVLIHGVISFSCLYDYES